MFSFMLIRENIYFSYFLYVSQDSESLYYSQNMPFMFGIHFPSLTLLLENHIGEAY